MDKRVKLAVIRKNDSEHKCPFGLPIPFGCHNAGQFIDRMAPFVMIGEDRTSDDETEIADANVKLLAWLLLQSTEETQKCPYAAKIMEQHDATECNYEDNAPGMNQQKAIQSGPAYSNVFPGLALNGLYSYPIGYYSDYNVSRNLFFGINSIIGSSNNTINKMGK